MRKFFSFLLIAVVVAITSHAVTVNNTAGQLSEKVTNLQLTQLTVTGTMDARDFLFITNELDELTSIDLSQVTIIAVNSDKPLYSTVATYRANEIPRTAFFGKKLTSVTLPTTLEGVGFAAFAGCDRLRSVTLPASVVRLDDYAFAGSGLTSVTIPATVASMGKGVFARCESLTSATLQGAIVGDFCFLGDINLSQVNIGPSVSYILKAVFSGCTSLTTINIDPACRINRIDDEAFINSGLASINLDNLGIGTIGDWAFAQTQLSSMHLPNGMTQLGEGALAHNPQLTSVIIPGARKGGPGRNAPSSPRHTIENIKDYTFAGDEVLNAGEMMREGVITIGNYALYNVCQEMDTMRLPSTLTYLGDYAMAGMIGMQTLKTDAEQVPALGREVWAGVDQPSVPLIAPTAESTAQYREADQWMNFFFEEQEPDIRHGDVNGDGSISMDDLSALINYLLTSDPTHISMIGADVNDDGDINMDDLSALINYLLTSSEKSYKMRQKRALPARYGTTSDQFAIASLTIAPGEIRTLDISLNNLEHVYTALQCEVLLPQGLRLVAVNGENRGKDHSFYTLQHQENENVTSLIGASINLDTFDGNEGVVMRFTLSADEDFVGNKASIILTNVSFVTKRSELYIANDAYAMVNDNTGVSNLDVDREVATVRYINIAGQESDTPFSGVNIVVTTYTDGTSSTTKVVK